MSVFTVHCGCLITPERKIKKNGKTYHYYHCTQYKGKHNAQYVNEEELTNQFSSIFSKLTIPKEIAEDIIEILKNNHKQKIAFFKDLLNRYQEEYQRYEIAIEKAYDDYLLGSITKEKYEEKRKEFRLKQEAIKEKMNKLHFGDEEYYLTSEYLLKLVANASKIFESSKAEEKRQLLKLTLSNLRLEGKKVLYDWLNPFDKIAELSSRQLWLPRQVSNLEPCR